MYYLIWSSKQPHYDEYFYPQTNLTGLLDMLLMWGPARCCRHCWFLHTLPSLTTELPSGKKTLAQLSGKPWIAQARDHSACTRMSVGTHLLFQTWFSTLPVHGNHLGPHKRPLHLQSLWHCWSRLGSGAWYIYFLISSGNSNVSPIGLKAPKHT